MCEINPKHTKILRLEFFTSHPSMTKEQFENRIATIVLETEIGINERGDIRCHIHENDIEEGLRNALKAIREGRGRYSSDQLTFANNVIDSMREIADKALEGTYPEEQY